MFLSRPAADEETGRRRSTTLNAIATAAAQAAAEGAPPPTDVKVQIVRAGLRTRYELDNLDVSDADRQPGARAAPDGPRLRRQAAAGRGCR